VLSVNEVDNSKMQYISERKKKKEAQRKVLRHLRIWNMRYCLYHKQKKNKHKKKTVTLLESSPENYIAATISNIGGEVKPSVPCRRFTACKRTLRA
jgi:hypothetical protein